MNNGGACSAFARRGRRAELSTLTLSFHLARDTYTHAYRSAMRSHYSSKLHLHLSPPPQCVKYSTLGLCRLGVGVCECVCVCNTVNTVFVEIREAFDKRNTNMLFIPKGVIELLDGAPVKF